MVKGEGKMGMYDYIDGVNVKCPTCEQEISVFQSKDGNCLLDHIDFRQVANFYTYCRYCGTWLEYNLKTQPLEDRNLDDYELTIEEKTMKVDSKGEGNETRTSTWT